MKKLLSICIFNVLTALLTAQVSKTVNVVTAGTLTTLLTETEKTTITDLTVTGYIDVTDIKCMRNEMIVLSVLDINAVTIQAYNGSGGTHSTTFYPANEMPIYSFYNTNLGTGKGSLKSVILPNNVTSIGSYAFSFCNSLNTINLTASIKTINNAAFIGCSALNEIILPTDLIEIGSYAFAGLTSIIGVVSFPNSLKSIGESAFSGCNGITSFIVQDSNPYLSTLDGVIFNKDLSALILFPLGKSSTYSVPNSVTSISNYAFNGCTNITTITFPTGLKGIGNYAFNGCSNISSLVLPSGLNSLGICAFSDCSGLQGELNIPASLNSISEAAFRGCSNISSLIIPAGLTNIGNGAFWYCNKLRTIYCLNENPPHIGNYCFFGVNSVTDVFVPNDDAIVSFRSDLWYEGIWPQGWGGFFQGSIIKKNLTTNLFEKPNDNIKVYSSLSQIIIDGTLKGERLTIYSLNGKKIQTIISKGERLNLPVDKDVVYFVRTGEKTFKVIL